MYGIYAPEKSNEMVSKGSQSAFERRLIREYLHNKGYRIEDLRNMPTDKAKRLMGKACRYASLKLAEIEAKAKFRKDIHSPDSS
jgi:hypothetical protein